MLPANINILKLEFKYLSKILQKRKKSHQIFNPLNLSYLNP